MKKLYSILVLFMKTKQLSIILSLLLIFPGIRVTAQEVPEKQQGWEPLPMENTAWIHFYCSLMTDTTYFQLGIKGDTIVNDKVYHKIIGCDHIGFPIEGECFGGIREDGNGKWYYLSFIPTGHGAPWPLELIGHETDNEFLIYDFSLSECDGFLFNGDDYLCGIPKYVFQTEEMVINGESRKIIWFDSNCEEGSHYYAYRWIEGIGNNQGLLYSLQILPTNGCQFHLVEILQDGEIMYTDPEFEGIDYNSINEPGLNAVSLYPNPITISGTLDFSRTDKAETLLIMSSDGRIVKREDVTNLSSFTLRKEDLGTGVFIYKLIGKQMNTVTGKICIY